MLEKSLYSRREILHRLSWLGVIAAGGLAMGPLVQYLVNDEDTMKSPLVTFKKQLEENSSWQNVPNTRVWVRKDQTGLMALVATCTHLGCEVQYYPDKKQWECPCHGSIYDVEGRPISGPAPKPMVRVAVEVKRDGSLVIQTNKQVGIDERAQ